MVVSVTGFNPSDNQTVHEIKVAANLLATLIEGMYPGRRRSVALTHLETATMWAVKAATVGDQ